MTRYFLINILLIALLTGCSGVAGVQRTASAKKADDSIVVWTDGKRSESQKNIYSISLKTEKNQISGLCILKKSGEEWRGTLVNEFGVKAFDFSLNEKKCTLLNVVPMMDKWYIKNTVEGDLHFLFEVDNKQTFGKKAEHHIQDDTLVVNYKKKQITVEPDGTVTLLNRRHNISYKLRKMVDIDPNKIILK